MNDNFNLKKFLTEGTLTKEEQSNAPLKYTLTVYALDQVDFYKADLEKVGQKVTNIEEDEDMIFMSVEGDREGFEKFTDTQYGVSDEGEGYWVQKDGDFSITISDENSDGEGESTDITPTDWDNEYPFNLNNKS